MKPYFTTKERQEELRRAVSAWDGTPFKHFSNVKGLGVDCNHYVLSVYRLAGFHVKIKLEPYAQDRHLHVAQEVLLTHVRSIDVLKEVNKNNPVNGDLLLYKFGLATSHPGIYCDGRICQSILRAGACSRTSFNEPMFNKRLTYVFRPMEL